MSEGPYRTPDPPPPIRLSLTEKLANVTERLAEQRTAKPVVGVLVIVGVVALVAAAFILPGLLILQIISMVNGKPLPTGLDRYGLAPILTGGAGLGGYFAFRFLRGFLEMASEIGTMFLRWLARKLS